MANFNSKRDNNVYQFNGNDINNVHIGDKIKMDNCTINNNTNAGEFDDDSDRSEDESDSSVESEDDEAMRTQGRKDDTDSTHPTQNGNLQTDGNQATRSNGQSSSCGNSSRENVERELRENNQEIAETRNEDVATDDEGRRVVAAEPTSTEVERQKCNILSVDAEFKSGPLSRLRVGVSNSSALVGIAAVAIIVGLAKNSIFLKRVSTKLCH